LLFFTVSIFETVLGALRTYVFAHTTNRIARLFRHLIALPIAYFEARRGGGSTWRGSRFIQPSAQAESIVPHSGGRNVS
jgi:ABC-type bacteriocin/lantibiotic exporter with double-glycine peptidase domain